MRLASLNTVTNNDAINAENNGDLPPKSAEDLREPMSSIGGFPGPESHFRSEVRFAEPLIHTNGRRPFGTFAFHRAGTAEHSLGVRGVGSSNLPVPTNTR
jgi:hypothetical protein